jgi:hypothetical protein
MGVVGTLLKNRRAGEAKLAWNLPNLSAPDTLVAGLVLFAAWIVRTVPGVTWGVDISPRGLFTGTAGHP